jgi:hypothetical protein
MVSKSRRPKRAAARASPRPAPTIVRERPAPVPIALREDPHAHIVCRVCGRIASLSLQQTDLWMLGQVAERRPDGWAVDGVTYTLTGACQRCRQGPPA